MNFRRLLTLPALLVFLAVACTDEESASTDSPTLDTEPDTEQVVGELIASWSEAVYEDLYDLTDTRLITDDAGRDDLLADVGTEPDTAAVEAADLDQYLLVVGGYHQCDEFAEVVASPDGSRLRFQVVRPDPGVECEWAPLQIEVHQVSRAAVSEDVDLDPEITVVDRPEPSDPDRSPFWPNAEGSLEPDERGALVAGEVVVAWSEANHDDFRDLYHLTEQPRLLSDSTDLDDFLSELGPQPDTSEAEAVDLDRYLLVMAAYPKCDEYAEVVVSEDRSRLEVHIVRPDPGWECVWAPLEIELHRVDRQAVADDVTLAENPVRVDLADAP